MTWLHICPSCHRVSWRYTTIARLPVCAHEYHDAKDCGVCGDCRNGGIRDASGRYLAPPQDALPERPPGPHLGNADAREPVK